MRGIVLPPFHLDSPLRGNDGVWAGIDGGYAGMAVVVGGVSRIRNYFGSEIGWLLNFLKPQDVLTDADRERGL